MIFFVIHSFTYIQCARDGNVDDLGRLLQSLQYRQKGKQNAVNAKDEKQLSPLHYAARYNQVEAVELLINYKAGLGKVVS